MREEEFLKQKDLLLKSIENNTMEHWKNYYKDVPVECIYEDLVIDINEIKRLTEENKKIRKGIMDLVDIRDDLQQRIDKAIDYIEFLLEPKRQDTSFHKNPLYILEMYNLLEALKGEDNE